MPGPHRSRHHQYIERYLATGEAHIIGIGREVEAEHKDASKVPVYLAVSEFRVAGEWRFAVFLHDISADLEVRDLRDRLAQAERISAARSLTSWKRPSRAAVRRPSCSARSPRRLPPIVRDRLRRRVRWPDAPP